MTWSVGSPILYRFYNQGRIASVVPAIVTEDRSDRVSFFVAAGTQIKERVRSDGSEILRSLSYRQRFGIDWKLGDGIWTRESFLWTTRPGMASNVGMIFAEDFSTFHGWYVNLQEPLRRSASGFDSADQVLDIQVAPSGEWTWKDEDEFAEALDYGRFTLEEAAAIRAEGERMIGKIERAEWPFQPIWNDWRPDPSWSIPAIPSNWDTDST